MLISCFELHWLQGIRQTLKMKLAKLLTHCRLYISVHILIRLFN